MREEFNAQTSREQLVDTLTGMSQAHRATANDYKGNATIIELVNQNLCHLLQTAFGLEKRPEVGVLKLNLHKDMPWDARRELAREAVERVEALPRARWQRYYDRSELETA